MYLLVTDKIIKKIKFPTLLTYGKLATPEIWTYLDYNTWLNMYNFMSCSYDNTEVGRDTEFWLVDVTFLFLTTPFILFVSGDIGFYTKLHNNTPMRALVKLKFTNFQHCRICLWFCENNMSLRSNFLEMHLACEKYWMWTMEDNWSSDFWLIVGYPVPKSGEKLTALAEVNCCLAATHEQSI